MLCGIFKYNEKRRVKIGKYGVFISDFRKWRLRFPVCERSNLNDRNIKKMKKNREVKDAKINQFSFIAFLGSVRCFCLDVSL